MTLQREVLPDFREFNRLRVMQKEEFFKLPLGHSDFMRLREEKCIYADKTEALHRLCSEGGRIFIARPRRFGKSLLTSTFDSLFRYGLRDFQGLAIEKLWKEKTHDVVHLDFSEVCEVAHAEDFRRQFENLLISSFAAAGLPWEDKKGGALEQTASWLSTLKPASLVILIDEYDAPLTRCIGNPTLLEDVRRLMRSFFRMLQENDRSLRFFFMTGITGGLADLFPDLHHLDDITRNSAYGTLIGFTEDEIEANFGGYLEKAQSALGMSREGLMESLRGYYGGYSFDDKAAAHVLCPWSVLNFFKYPERGFRNYWFDSGGRSAVLMKILAHAGPLSFAEARRVPLSESGALRTMDDIRPEALLAQAGYLAIRAVAADGSLVLGYPNKEVSTSMGELYAGELLGGKPLDGPEESMLSETLRDGTVEAVIERFSRVLKAIDSERFPIRDEAGCCAVLQVLLIGAAKLPKAEAHHAPDGSSLAVETGTRHWVFEFKYSQTGEDSQELFEEALNRIRSRDCGEAPHEKELIRVVLVFDGSRRQFLRWARL